MKEFPFPMPNDPCLGGTVVASCHYSDDYALPLALVLLLMPTAPYYRVGVVWCDPDGYEWDGVPTTHRNIVHATQGDGDRWGYIHMGGDI